jgi:hypothetical protein
VKNLGLTAILKIVVFVSRGRLVICEIRLSIFAAYRSHTEETAAFPGRFYDKLNGCSCKGTFPLSTLIEIGRTE